MPHVCESKIDRVEVYARGAIVRRVVTLPEGLSGDAVDLAIGGITRLAEPGSVRAVVDGEREIVALRARVVVPEVRVRAGELTVRARELSLELTKLDAAREQLAWRRGALRGTWSVLCLPRPPARASPPACAIQPRRG